MKKTNALLLSFLLAAMSLAGCFGGDGNDGDSGNDGTNGLDGTNGIAGPDGLNALVTSKSEPAGPHCTNGGIQIDVGIDDNGDGVLETNEIDQTQYICDGGSSSNTTLTSITSTPTEMGCNAGGKIISHGLDNGNGGGTSANGVLELEEIEFTTTSCSWWVPGVLKKSIGASSFAYRTAVGNILYFTASNGINGAELWKSDGTEEGTVMVKDINPTGSSSPESLTAVGNILYFRSDDGVNGDELWKSDGTEEGTIMVHDLNSSGSSYPYYLTAVGNTLYFYPLYFGKAIYKIDNDIFQEVTYS